MKTNILRNSELASVYLSYVENGLRTKLRAKIRFLDTKECYIATEIPLQLKKPKRKQPAEIVAYTEDGVYKAQVKIMDCNISGNEVLYITELPSQWNFYQLRKSSRKKVNAEFNITFNDGFQIKAETYDISLGGISFSTEEHINDIYTRVSGILSMELPSNSYADITAIKIKTEAKFLRIQKSKQSDTADRYVYKFINLPDDQMERLKSYLIRLY